jgi:predicted O-methyltransferase YrrM
MQSRSNTRTSHIEAKNPRLRSLRRIVLIAWTVWAILSTVGTVQFGIAGLAVSLVVLGLLLIILILTVYQHLALEGFHHYRQIEASFSLYSSVRIEHPLPPMRLWAISPDFANLLVSLIREHQPQRIVELGTGVSTLICSYTLRDWQIAGRLMSFEHLVLHAQESTHNLMRHELNAYAVVVHAPLKNVRIASESWQWYDLAAFTELEEIDFLIVDGPPEETSTLARYPAMPVLFERLTRGAIIVVDDYMRHEEWAIVDRWLREYDLELLNSYANEKGAAVLRKR